MRVLLIYNPNAGDGVHNNLRELVDLIHAAGHELRCRSSKDPLIASAFGEPADLVAVAGGDGTIVKVARLLRGRKTPIAPLPMGTANNISTALGLTRSSLEEQIFGWKAGETIMIDIGLARGPRGARSFLESFGAGLLPRVMAQHERAASEAGAEARLADAVSQFRRAAQRAPAIEVKAQLDERDVSGRYVLIEAMNVGWAGPKLNLAAEADPADGQLDLVLVPEADRALLLECLVAREHGAAWPHRLRTFRGRHVRIEQANFSVHVDDDVWHDERSRDGEPRVIDVFIRERMAFLLPPGRDSAWQRVPVSRRAIQQGGRLARPEVTPAPWGWPAAGRARFRR